MSQPVEVLFRIEDPGETVTDEQLVEWLAFELHASPSKRLSNPLDVDIDPCLGSLRVRRRGQPLI